MNWKACYFPPNEIALEGEEEKMKFVKFLQKRAKKSTKLGKSKKCQFA